MIFTGISSINGIQLIQEVSEGDGCRYKSLLAVD